jgi:ankyrin repeat protein
MQPNATTNLPLVRRRRKAVGVALLIQAATVLLYTVSIAIIVVDAYHSEESPASRKMLQLCLSEKSDVTTVAAIQELFNDEQVAKTIDINTQDAASGQTCVMASVLRGKSLTVELLLFQGADPSIPEKDGYTPPHGAAFQGRTEVMAVLHEYGLSNQDFHKDGYLPFHRACWGQTQRHAVFVNYLLKMGIVNDVNVPSQSGKTCRDMTRNRYTVEVLDRWEIMANQKATSEGGKDEL